MKINEVIILVGGRGERLKPLTNLYPKPLLMVNGKPFLEILINSLKNKFKKFILCSWYKHEMFDNFIQYYTCKNSDIVLINSVENTKLGTGGALKNAEKFIKDDYFIVVNGDTLFDISTLDYILNEADSDFLINEVVDEVYIPTGVRIFDSIILGLIPYGYCSLEDDLCTTYPKNIIQIEGSFIDIGTMETYKISNEIL